MLKNDSFSIKLIRDCVKNIYICGNFNFMLNFKVRFIMFIIIQTPVSYNVVDCLTFKTVARFSTKSKALSWLYDCSFNPLFDRIKIYKTEIFL